MWGMFLYPYWSRICQWISVINGKTIPRSPNWASILHPIVSKNLLTRGYFDVTKKFLKTNLHVESAVVCKTIAQMVSMHICAQGSNNVPSWSFAMKKT